jgi:hypothetical protein
MSPAICENVSCNIDYGVSLSLAVIDYILIIAYYILCIYFTMEKMELWSSGDVVNSVLVIPCAGEEEG